MFAHRDRAPAEDEVEGSQRREFLISRGWIQAVVLVVLCGFFVLGLLAYRTCVAHPPVPKRVADPQGWVLFTGTDVRKGQQVFLHNGLMEYGSAFGHRAYLGPDFTYLGPDFTADYLRRAADLVKRAHGGPASDSAARRTIEDFRTNRYVERTGTLTLTGPRAQVYRALVGHYGRSSRTRGPTTACAARRSRTRPRSASSRRSSPGRRGRRRRSARATTTPTRTTGLRSRASATSPRRT